MLQIFSIFGNLPKHPPFARQEKVSTEKRGQVILLIISHSEENKCIGDRTLGAERRECTKLGKESRGVH